MVEELLLPDYVFESSWEVCNKVGGIYTVLSTRARTLQQRFRDKLIFIGPDLWADAENPLFEESASLYADWKGHAAEADGLAVRVGRWNVPGRPVAILVDFRPFFSRKNEIYTEMWNRFEVDSLHAYGDYDESSLFAYAAGRVVESFYRYQLMPEDKVVFQVHEWMSAMGALYVREAVPEIATVFTTHATTVGRSIAGNHKPLYDYLFAYQGDQMAQELNVRSKHSVEKQAAHHADCFTTVSEITATECRQLLEKPVDVVQMNGFEDDFVPKPAAYRGKRKRARALLLDLAHKLTGVRMDPSTLIVGTSGRYEFKNKGIDVFLEAMARLNADSRLDRSVLAFVCVPGWVAAPREDLRWRMQNNNGPDKPLEMPCITHRLHDMQNDQVLGAIRRLGLNNEAESKVKVVFIPCYLDGNDGILNTSYYDILPALDLTVYPSYYEPWGYTPLESVAFGVPTVTTDLAGFGRWANGLNHPQGIEGGVEVLHRSDYNDADVAEGICETLLRFSEKTETEVGTIRKQAAAVASQALWKHFIRHYDSAYDVALRRARQRMAD